MRTSVGEIKDCVSDEAASIFHPRLKLSGEASMLAVSKHGMSHQHTDPDSTSEALLAASFDSRTPTAILNAAASIISPLLGPCDEEAECHCHGYVTATMRHHESVVKQEREANDAQFSLRDALPLPTELSTDS